LQDKNGNIWFSNWDGVYRYDPSASLRTGPSAPLRTGSQSFTGLTKKDGLSGDMVARIIEDKNGNLWFGGAGLSRYDGKSFTRFTTKDGLPNLGVWSILEDTSGNLWVGTRENGLYLFDGKTFITYSKYK
jgi:ligand-binding sensor domain-containing protein